MTPRFLVLISSLALSVPSSVSAQTRIVSPGVFTKFEGTAANTHPLGAALVTSPSMRYLAVHDDMQNQGGLLKEMGFRLTAASAGVATSIVMEVVISTATTTSATMSTTFDNNHGIDKATVVPASAQFNYPAYPVTVLGPAPFFYRVPFNTPFAFAGAGPLCWEFRIASRTNTTAFSLDSGSGTFVISTQALGTGCLSTGRTAVATTTATLSGANLTVSAASLAANAVAIAVLGLRDTNWSGIPLPLLVPGSVGAPSGPCNVWTDMTIMQVFTAAATGAGSAVIPAVPASTQWLGLHAYSWVLAVDPPANPLGIVTTNYRDLTWGDNSAIRCGRVFAFNNVSAPTGSLDSTAIIVEFVF